MSLARGSICWRDFDGIRRRICDLDNGPPDFQCPNPATGLLVVDNGDCWYVCSEQCLNHARKGGVTEEQIPVVLLGETPSGFTVWIVTSPTEDKNE